MVKAPSNKIETQDLVTHALDTFNASVSDLGSTYQDLKKRIDELNVELAEKNKQLEENLYEGNRLRRFLDAILNSMTDGVVVVDTQGQIVLFNQGAENLSGFDRSEVMNRPYLEVFGRIASRRFSPLYTLSDGESLICEEKEIRSKGGENVPVRYSTSLVTDNLGRTLGAVEVFSDLSKIRQLESQMQRIKTQTALNQMAALVAHEIRNPLGGIRGYVDLLKESIGKEDEEKNAMFEHVISSVRTLDETVANFEHFARPVKPNFEHNDLLAYINDIVEYFQNNYNLRKQRINLIVHYPPDAGEIIVRMDPILLEQAILAVLDNAFRAMPDGGTLRLEVQEAKSLNRRESSHVSLVISDSGEGMEKEVCEKLFDPFFTTRERGMGLGLSLARNFISFHHGEILVESQPGKGSAVTIILPKR